MSSSPRILKVTSIISLEINQRTELIQPNRIRIVHHVPCNILRAWRGGQRTRVLPAGSETLQCTDQGCKIDNLQRVFDFCGGLRSGLGACADRVLQELIDDSAGCARSGGNGRVTLVGVDLLLEGGEVVEEGDVAGLDLEEDADDGEGLVDRVTVDQVQLSI